jgi:hypothetical protein
MTKRQSVEALDNSLHDIMDQPDLPFGGRQWCLVEISGKSSLLFEGGQGSNCRCLIADIVPLEIHVTPQTIAQHEGTKRPMVCRIPFTCRWWI